MKEGLVTFIHIPKTGGVTIHDILSRIYSAKRTVHVPAIRQDARKPAIEHANDKQPFLIKGHIAAFGTKGGFNSVGENV